MPTCCTPCPCALLCTDAETKTLNIHQFMQLLDDANLITDESEYRLFKFAFVYSQMMVKDEMVTEDHQRMEFVEFLEAVSVALTCLRCTSAERWRYGDGVLVPQICRVTDYRERFYAGQSRHLPLCQRLPDTIEALLTVLETPSAGDGEEGAAGHEGSSSGGFSSRS